MPGTEAKVGPRGMDSPGQMDDVEGEVPVHGAVASGRKDAVIVGLHRELASLSPRRMSSTDFGLAPLEHQDAVGSIPYRAVRELASRGAAPVLIHLQRVIKRWIDILVAACGLGALSPLLLILAGLIRLDSPGPSLFRQKRIGRWGRDFEIIKFRTMANGAERLRDMLLEHSIYTDARLFKIPHDPRVTRLGKLLRRTSLDELPQLWNVLRGEMSLVGPRPPLPTEVDLYESSHLSRLDVPPGITGPWQVAGRNMITDFDQVFALERSYIEHWNLWKDLLILLKTIPVVLLMRGAH